jgi:hypothetical protein
MVRLTLAAMLFVSTTFVLACGAGPTNSGGAPNVNNTNRTGLPGGEINTRGGFGSGGNNGGAPSFDKTNPKGLPGGPINAGGGFSDGDSSRDAKQAPSAAADGGVDL